MAPELLKGEVYNELVDVWSIGVITFMLLTGQMLYNANTTRQTKQLILNSKLEDRLNDKSCKNMSSAAKQFILTCLTKDAKTRPTCEQMLKHDFITKNEQVEEVTSENRTAMAENIKNFA